MRDRQKQVPTVLLLEEDDETRRPLVTNLRSKGYRVLVAVDMENALVWIENLAEKPDVFLINQVNTSLEEYLKTIRSLYQQTTLSTDTPTVILAERYPDYLEGSEKIIDGNIFIVFLENVEQLFNLLYCLCFKQ
ncbi:hypothetical protein [Myxosarcina sp. GI1]|uniref:hypothetical protein n=1 Tax=Myxosarcina sp. GI1 TaxID=1541065 RepID=UPI0012DFF37E|nr:hypothetical protein [Myxosarcina sp. GI1]